MDSNGTAPKSFDEPCEAHGLGTHATAALLFQPMPAKSPNPSAHQSIGKPAALSKPQQAIRRPLGCQFGKRRHGHTHDTLLTETLGFGNHRINREVVRW